MGKLKAYYLYFLRLLFNLCPLKKNQVFFNSFNGMYSDSPRYISERLHEQNPDVRIVWETANKSHEQLPSYVKTVNNGTVSAIFENCVSSISVDNYMGACYGHTANRKKAFILGLSKRKSQYSICTWHGTALKKINADEPRFRGKKPFFYTTADVLSCGNVFMKELYDRQNEGKLETVLWGTPRNDILLNIKSEEKISIKKHLNLPLNKKILLFAPTFRVSDEINKKLQDIDYKTILNACANRFGGDWVFVFRAHDSLVDYLRENSSNPCAVSGNVGDDMAQYLAVADILLTDYSSSMFDFLLTNRPCYLYCPDLTEYSTVERGLYFNMDELPFAYAETIESLVYNISCFNQEEYVRKIDTFLKKIGNVEDGNSTQKIVDLITLKLKGATR